MAKGTTRRINIYINGKEVENNIKSIRAEMTKLINEQNRMTIGSDEYVAHGKKIREVRAYIQQHNDSLKSATQSWQNLISKILQFGAGFGGFSQMLSTFDQGIASLKKMATDLAAMDDIYSDVIKYTGLTKDEVHDLNAEFKKMNTRTAREELNRLAAEAGKIGLKSKEDLLSFVEAANIIQVSLGEDLGEDAVKQIGKLTKMFGESDKHGLREAMLKVGSTINEVAQNSTAAEPYLLQFTNRLSGIGNQAGLTIAQIVGFGSVLDQNAQALELSSTALDKFIVNLVNDTETVAKAAGVPVKELTELIGTDMNSAILRVFESLNQKGGLVDLAPLFKDLGAEGARAAKIISVLAQKYPDIVREQELATQAYQDGASVLNEYEVKNNNLQAELEKARKRFQDMRLELGEKLYPILVKLTKTSTTGLKLISTFTTAIVENKGAVIALAAPYAAYLSKLILVTTYSKAENLYDKAAISLKSAKKSAILASSVAYNTLAGNTTRAAAAQKLLRAQFASTPWGAILTGLTSVAVGIYKLATNTSIAEKSFKKFNEESAKQESNARMLFTSLQNTTKGSDEYRTVLEKLKELYPDIISSMIDERGELQNIEKAYNLVTEAIRKKIAMQIKDETISEAISDNLKNQKNQIEDIRKRLQKQGFGEEVSQLFIDDIVKAINENKSFDTILKELENKYKGVDIAGHIWGGIAQDISSMVWSSKEMNQTITDTEKIFSSIIGLQKESNDEMKLQQLQRELAAAETKDEKNAIREQIALLQKKKELITTDNNTSTSPGSSPDENTVKKWDTFYKKIEDIRSKYIIKEEFDYSREKQSIKREFESMIKEAEEFAKENPSYAKRIGEIVKELNEKEIEALEKS